MSRGCQVAGLLALVATWLTLTAALLHPPSWVVDVLAGVTVYLFLRFTVKYWMHLKRR